MVIPEGCVGLPTLAAMEQGIPVIAVRENHNCMKNDLEELPFEKGKFFIAENYLEAVGIMTALKEGVTLSSVRRPLADTVVTCGQDESQVEKEVETKGAGLPRFARNDRGLPMGQVNITTNPRTRRRTTPSTGLGANRWDK